jgi:type III pantothenate kinase
MTPDVVVDVGNTRIKWGRCEPDAVVEMASLPPDDPAAWERQLQQWQFSREKQWVLAAVHPARLERLANWLHHRGERVRIVTHPRDLPLRTLLAEPEKAGIDRLLDAVAANLRRRPDRAAVIVDAGSAVTVDLVDESGAFAGGAIFPGLRLMAKALHDYTALLPVIEIPRDLPPVPGKTTIAAMELGIFWSVVGGIEAITSEFRRRVPSLDIFLTGGDAALLHLVLSDGILWPEMTLEGLRWTAENLS